MICFLIAVLFLMLLFFIFWVKKKPNYHVFCLNQPRCETVILNNQNEPKLQCDQTNVANRQFHDFAPRSVIPKPKRFARRIIGDVFDELTDELASVVATALDN